MKNMKLAFASVLPGRDMTKGRRLILVAATIAMAAASTGAYAISIGSSHPESQSARGQWSTPANQADAPIVFESGGAQGQSGNFNAVYCLSNSNCIAVGGDDKLNGIVGVTSNNGGSWLSSTVQNNIPMLNAVTCISVSRCVAVGQGGFSVSTDGGANWSTSAVPTNNTTLLGINCPNTTNCVSVGVSPGDNGPYSGVVLHSTDGGSTWTPASVPGGSGALGSVSCPSQTFCVAVGASLLESTDGGVNWHSVAVSGGTGVLRSVACSSATNCVAVGPNPAGFQDASSPGFAVVTTDGGATWNPVVLPVGTSSVETVQCSTSGTCEAAGSSTGSTPAPVLVSNNSGKSWNFDTQVMSPSLNSIGSIAFTSNSGLLFIGRNSNGAISYSSKGTTGSGFQNITSLVRTEKGQGQ